MRNAIKIAKMMNTKMNLNAVVVVNVLGCIVNVFCVVGTRSIDDARCVAGKYQLENAQKAASTATTEVSCIQVRC